MSARCQTFSIVHSIDSFPIDQTQSVNSLRLVLLPKNCLVAAGDDQDIFLANTDPDRTGPSTGWHCHPAGMRHDGWDNRDQSDRQGHLIQWQHRALARFDRGPGCGSIAFDWIG